MAVTKWVGQTTAQFKFGAGATAYESSITGFREITQDTGGQSIELADGTVLQTVTKRTVVAVEVDCIQSTTSTDLWRYLRETASTTGTLVISGTGEAAESSTNPEWSYSVTGWAFPELQYAPGQSPTPTARFTVTGNPTVDVTP